MNFLGKSKIISKDQYGFTNNKSKFDVIYDITDFISFELLRSYRKSKLKKENEQLREESRIMRCSQGTIYENKVAGKRDKENKCSPAECGGGKERK